MIPMSATFRSRPSDSRLSVVFECRPASVYLKICDVLVNDSFRSNQLLSAKFERFTCDLLQRIDLKVNAV